MNAAALFRPCGFLLLVIALTLCPAGFARASSDPDVAAGIKVAGIVTPQNVLLTPEHPIVTKPLAVVIQNTDSKPKVIPDAATLQEIVDLEVNAADGNPVPQPVIIPPKSFPIRLQPNEKLSVVFRMPFVRGGPLSVSAMHGIASAPLAASGPTAGETATAGETTSAVKASAGVVPFASDQGAFIVASSTVTALQKNQSSSNPITLTAKWPGQDFFVSEWEENPSDSVADPILQNSQDPSVDVRWGNPGEYVVDVWLTPIPYHGQGQADPSITIDVVQVQLQDEKGNDLDGATLGVSTSTDRSRTWKAVVNPPQQAQSGNVTVKVSKGGSNLTLSNITNGSGAVTFTAKGTGKTGSASQGDCTIEADVGGKKAATANVTVVVPKKLSQSQGAAYWQNLQANSTTTPALPSTPGPLLATTETFYGFPVTVTVRDQFGNLITDPNNPHLYQGAPVSEAFQVAGKLGSPAPINLTIRSTSDYVDPVGFQVWQNSFYGASAPRTVYNPFFNPGTSPLYGIPNFPANNPPSITTFQVVVDGFPVEPIITRTLNISGTTVTLTESP